MFPVVSEEVCNNIREQFNQCQVKYMDSILAELQENNPELGSIIMESAQNCSDILTEKFDLNLNESIELRANILWQMLATYNSIKQQLVIIDLEST